MSVSIARTAVASAIACLSFVGTASAAAPKYKLVLIDGTTAVSDVANHGWSVASATLLGDRRCQRQACTPVPSLPNGKNLTMLGAEGFKTKSEAESALKGMSECKA